MFFGKRFPRRKELNGEIKNVQRIEMGTIRNMAKKLGLSLKSTINFHGNTVAEI